MSKKSTIHFIITGGTIDSHYDGTKDTAITNKESVIPNYIKSLKLPGKSIFSQVCMKDSRNLSKTDIRKILKAVEQSKTKKIIITHGTYTMPDTAKYLQANLKDKNKTIILTGSMIPLVGFSPSDAGFHLGYSISEIKNLDNGVYVCMNGQIFSPDEVVKQLKDGKFDSVFNR